MRVTWSLALLLVAGGARADATGSPIPGTVEVPMYVGDDKPVALAIAKAFVRPMLKVPDGKPTPPFEWGKHDVLGTGYGEIFLAFKGPEQCSDAGCPLLVMERKGDGAWAPILTAVATSVAAVSTGTKVSDILVRGERGQATTWTWDGAKRTMVVRRP